MYCTSTERLDLASLSFGNKPRSLNLALHYYASGSYARLTESQRSDSATASPLLSA